MHSVARGLGFHMDGDDFNYDIDTIKVKNSQVKFVSDIAIFVLKRDVELQLTNSQVKWLPYLAYGVVDGSHIWQKTDTITTILTCALSTCRMLIFVFIPRNKKQSFAQGLCLSIGDRFMPISPHSNRLLDHTSVTQSLY